MVAIAVLVALCQPKVNYIDVVTSCLRATNQEVVWLNVTVNDSAFVTFLNTADKLDCNHQDSFEIQLSLAVLKQIF